MLMTGTQALASMSCGDLFNVRLNDTVINTAELVEAGSLEVGGAEFQVPDMCRVAGTISPAINFEVWLPLGDDWNGRFQEVGGGGLAGNISYSAMVLAVNDGYVTSSTDTGHVSSDLSWTRDSGRVEDYGYRAIHETAVQSKAILSAYYGRIQDYAYFNGCSTGGRQGLMEAQRYPDDFDGIVSGAPVNNFTHLHIGQLWMVHSTLKVPGAKLSPSDFSMVMDAVLESCDAIDGVEDGFLTNPKACKFDPSVLQCNRENSDSCLAAEQITALEMIYQGAVNPRTGDQIYPGLELGGEGAQPGNAGWSMIMGDGPFFMDTAVLGGMGFETDDFQWRDFDFDGDVATINAKLFGVLNAINPDLRDFENKGGKLLMYHGWNDPGVMPQQTIDYYNSVIAYREKAMGSLDAYLETAEYARLFMMPGMGHCRGGAGPDEVDFMSAIVDWVENDDAPEKLISSKTIEGKETMSRPICPVPEMAVYDGRGDTNKASNFDCR